MAIFEKVSKYKDQEIEMPCRKTAESAGYDMVAAEDTVVPSIWLLMSDMEKNIVNKIEDDECISLEQIAMLTKALNAKPTLVSTGMKCKLDPGTFLQLSVRSSCPLKHWIMMANSVGIIDADYYNNESNEGEIFFQLYNLSPFNIIIHKGEAIGQGIILPYLTTENDIASGIRIGGFGSTSDPGGEI